MTEGSVKLISNQKSRKELANFIESSLTFVKFESDEILVCEHKIFFGEYLRPGGSDIMSSKDQLKRQIQIQNNPRLFTMHYDKEIETDFSENIIHEQFDQIFST